MTVNMPDQRPHGMTVEGSATVELEPDCFDLTMTVAAQDSRADHAAREAEQVAERVQSRLHEAGAASSDVKLSSVSLQPYFRKDVREVHDYEAQITIVVTTRDFTKIIPLMDAGADVGVTGIASRFRRSDLDAQRKHVRELAIAAAKAKAEQMAQAVGVKLGPVVSVNENPNGAMWSNEYFPAAAGRAATATAEPLTLDVTIGYELAGAAT